MMKRLTLQYIRLSKIDVSLSNARKANLEEGIDELARSIQEIGLQQPVVVYRKKDARFELIIGQRRYFACERLALPRIAAIVTSVKDETDALVKSFSENIHRLDLEYRDKMTVATRLLNELGSVGAVAARLGVSGQTVRNYLGYAAVPERIKQLVDRDKLSATTALRIANRIPDEARAFKIAQKVREAPRSEDKLLIIDVAQSDPSKTPEEVVKRVRRMKRFDITLHLPPRVADGLDRAGRAYESDHESVAIDAIEEWLDARGFLR